MFDDFVFLEFSAPDCQPFDDFFIKVGFKKVDLEKDIARYSQGNANFIVNNTADSFAKQYALKHNCFVISGYGIKTENAADAIEHLGLPQRKDGLFKIPAVDGPAGTLIYLVDSNHHKIAESNIPSDTGVLRVDHFTTNFPKGQLKQWSDTYQNTFGFKKVHDFKICFNKTYYNFMALVNHNNKIRLPLNEALDDLSSVAEFLRIHVGIGMQHIALEVKDIFAAIRKMSQNGIEFLSVPDTYYDGLAKKFPTLDIESLKALQILVDGQIIDGKEQIILQIFTVMHTPPLYIELIERRDNQGFGEGNVNALSIALEEDQKKRGVLS